MTCLMTSAISLKRGSIGPRLLLMTNRKSYTRFRLLPKSTTFDDLEGHYALCFKARASFGAHHENLNEDWLHYQRRRCSPMTLYSDNIRFMRIFAVVLKIYVNFPWILCLRPYIRAYVYRKCHAEVIFNFKCLFMTVNYQYGCWRCWSAWLAEKWEAEYRSVIRRVFGIRGKSADLS